MGARPERVAEEIRGAIARLLRTEVSDPRLAAVCITAVECSKDLRNAKVYWNLVDADPDERAVAQVDRAIGRAASYLRRGLAESLGLRATPELAFRYDASIERGRRMEDVLRALSSKPE